MTPSQPPHSTPPQARHDKYTTLPDVLRVVVKRKGIVLISTALSLVVSLFFIRKQAPVYRTHASVELDQFFYLSPGGRGYSWTDSATESYIITSLPVLHAVAERMEKVPGGLDLEEIAKNEVYFQALKSIQGRIEPKARETTMILDIHVTSGDPKEAQTIANLTAKAYQEYRNSRNQDRGRHARDLSAENRERLETDLAVAEAELNDFKLSHRIVEAESSFGVQLGRLLDLEEREQELDRRKDSVREILGVLSASRTVGQAALTALAFPGAPPAYERLRSEFEDLVLELAASRRTLTDSHPAVEDLKTRVAMAQSRMILLLEKMIEDANEELAGISDQRLRLEASKVGLLEDQVQLVRLQRRVDRTQGMLDEMEKAWQTMEFEQTFKGELVRVIELALLPTAPVSKMSFLPAVSIMLVGLLLGVGLAFLRESFDFSLDSVVEVESLIGLPVLSVIPHFDPEEAHKRATRRAGEPAGLNANHPEMEKMVAHYFPKDPTSESFRILRMAMRRGDRDLRLFLVTSATPQEGKSFLTSNLAIAFAQASYSTLLVEANTRRPTMHKIFPMKPDRGLTNVLLDNVPWRSLVRNIYDLIVDGLDPKTVQQSPGLDNLKILPAGPTPVHPSETLEQLMRLNLFQEMKDAYEVVIVDCPPILPVADAAVIAPNVDGVVLAYRIGRTPRDMLLRAIETMKGVHANLLGLVLNDIDYQGPYFYPRYHYRYQYRSDVAEGTNGSRRPLKDRLLGRKPADKAPESHSDLTALD